MTTWRMSSYSNNGSCVAVAAAPGAVLVRNSNHPDRGTIAVSPAAMAAFVDASRAGELDGLAPA